MEAGNHQGDDRLGATLVAHNFDESPSTSSPRPYQRYHHYHDHRPQHTPSNSNVGPLIPSDYHQSALGDHHHPLSPDQLASYAAQNYHAAHANATIHVPVDVVNPDDFYRAHTGADTYDELMASAIPVPRQGYGVSLRSHGTPAPSKHPPIPSTRNGLRPALRSVSAPVDDKTPNPAAKSRPAVAAGYGGRTGQKPSVKDLKKRFDQHAQTSSAAPQKPNPRAPSRETPSPARYRVTNSPSSANGPGSYTALRSSVTRDFGASTSSRATQRSRAVPEDQLSNNSQSFASRVAKPRTPASAQAHASKSMTNLSPTASPGSIPPMPQSRSLLFGEIGPGEIDAGTVGYGIDGARSRRTSESNLAAATGLRQRQRSLSHADVEPASPSDWYRGTNGEFADRDDTDSSGPKASTGHSRSRSDLAGSTSTTIKLKTPQLSVLKKPAVRTTPPLASSRLPVSVRKLSSPSGSSSPSSTRSNSPSTLKRPPHQGKTPKSTPTSRSRTPTTNVPTSTTKRPNRLGAVTPNGNARLNAYISTPPPKLSPPLRSSRPRQPVSSASTTSSRMKTVERSRSPTKAGSKSGPRSNEQGTRRRKISMGPIDFESRREQIKLSYSKSIRDNEARAIARKVAEERKRKAEAEAEALRAEIAAAEKRQQEEQLEQEKDVVQDAEVTAASPAADSPTLRTITAGLILESPTDTEASPVVERQPLRTITTGLLRQDRSEPNTAATGKDRESPTLGIPGSFPDVGTPEDDDVPPPSAISNTTEFDAEPQTEPPLQEVLTRPAAPAVDATDDYFPPTYSKSEYRSPFDESPTGEEVPIHIALEPAVNTKPDAEQATANTSDVYPGQPRSGPYEDEEYEPKPYVTSTGHTKVTIIGRDADFPSSTSDSQAFAAKRPTQTLSRSSSQLRAPDFPHTPASSDKPDPRDEQPAPSAGLSDIEEFFVGPIIKDSSGVSQNTSSKETEYDDHGITTGQHTVEDSRFSLESRRTGGTRPSLTVPRTSDSVNRISQTTIWTDYSSNSQEDYSEYEQRAPQKHSSVFDDGQSIFESGPGQHSYSYHQDSRDVLESPKSSPRTTHGEIETAYGHQHRLPELDTGGGFAVDYITRKNSTQLSAIPVLPDHAPPPPPDEISIREGVSSAAASECLDDARLNSSLHGGKDDQSIYSVGPSRRESEDFGQLESAGRSIDQGSLDISESIRSGSTRFASQQTLAESIDQTSDGQGLTDKERKRLFTRLEIIKELIDTEAFFIRDMNIVEEIYKGTAEACPKLDDKTIKLIFRNTDQIIKFHSIFLLELKEGVASVYTPKGQRNNSTKDRSVLDGTLTPSASSTTTATARLSDNKDRETSLGPIFIRNIEKMKIAHETFLKNSDHAAKRLIQIQADPTVKVWLNECNEVARDLTKAWNLDSLLIKPMQRITKYPNLLIQLLHETPSDHPDRQSLESAKAALEDAIEEINKTKKNFELVGQIVGRKRKESDVRAGFARAFGKRVDKLQASTNRPPEDAEYLKLHERFGDDYLRLQVVLRDVEYYTRQVADYVREFLQYLSSMELVMRLQPSPHPEIESKWVRFNVSMRDIEKVALDQHLSQVRKQVIEPFELVIKSYSNPSLAMKKRNKRRVDYEKSLQLTKSGKKVDKQLAEFVEQYEALNEALKKELPKLSALTEKVGNICLGNLVNIQTQWYAIWKEKVKVVLEDPEISEISDIVTTFQRDYKFQEEEMNAIGIVNPASRGRPSQSISNDDSSSRLRPRPLSPRSRGLSLNSDTAPSIPTPDFMKRHSGQFTVSASPASIPSPHHYYYRDYYSGVNGQAGPGSATPNTPDPSTSVRSLAAPSARPGTGQSHDSNGIPRQSTESATHSRRYSNSMYPSPYPTPDTQRYSGLFQSALPISEGQVTERAPRPSLASRASSRTSSRERQPVNGYNVLWLAASLFEFNIETTKHEAGYPYLTYAAGEIFDVIAEKGELWLAKNQDDPNNMVGWLWSKHFAKLADD